MVVTRNAEDGRLLRLGRGHLIDEIRAERENVGHPPTLNALIALSYSNSERDGMSSESTDVIDVRPDEGFPTATLAAYLDGRVQGAIGEPTVRQFAGGHANLTYLLSFPTVDLVLRRPPLGPVAPGSHDMAREYGVLSRLYRAFPPAPRAYLLCEDEAVIGAPFLIMETKARDRGPQWCS